MKSYLNSHVHFRALGLGSTAIIALLLSLCCQAAVSQFEGLSGGGIINQAYAAIDDDLTAGSIGTDLGKQSSGFKASTYKLDLSPKIKKVPYGHKYVPVHKTVTIKIPDSSYYPIYWKSSNPKVATATDSCKAKEMKLTVYGHSAGKSTITITNSATYETIKIQVVVKGYNSKEFKASKTSFDLKQKKKKISGGYKYSSTSQTIIVAFPDGATGTWKSSDSSIADAEWSNKWVGNTMKLKIKGHRPGKATLTLKNTKKRVYVGDKIYAEDVKGTDASYWEKGIFTAKIGKAYKTIYVNSYGMVTKVLNGRKI